LKHHHLQAALSAMVGCWSEDDLSVTNGLQSEEIIGAACGIENMLFAITVNRNLQ